MAPSIFDFQDFGTFLAAEVARRKAANPRFSYRVLARRVTGCSHNVLLMIAQGKRQPGEELLRRLSAALALSEEESAYARAVVGMTTARDAKERAYFAGLLEELGPVKTRRLIDDGLASYIAEWRHVAVLEMVNLAGFQADPEWISGRLGGRVSPGEAAESLALLEQLELLGRDEAGRPRRNEAKLATPSNVPSAAIRAFHRQMLRLAEGALEAQDVSRRYFTGTTMTIDPKDLADMSGMIAEFRAKLIRLFQRPGGQETYHLAVQLFALTEPAAEALPAPPADRAEAP